MLIKPVLLKLLKYASIILISISFSFQAYAISGGDGGDGGSGDGSGSGSGDGSGSGSGSGGIVISPPGDGDQSSSSSVISNEPLFLSVNVSPNVFFELDDSGSMDWDILTGPYFHACSYDNNNPATTSQCTNKQLITTGSWNATYHSNTSSRTHYYLYKHSDDALSWAQADSSYAIKGHSSIPNNSYKDEVKRRYDAGYLRWIFVWDWRGRSSDFNAMYFNPKLFYSHWVGTTFPKTGAKALSDANFTAVRSNPVEFSPGYTAVRSLEDMYTNISGNQSFVYEVWVDSSGYKDAAPEANKSSKTDTPNEMVDFWDDHVRYTATSTGLNWVHFSYTFDSNDKLTMVKKASGSIGLTDKDNVEVTVGGKKISVGSGKTGAALIQNIANWYEYARRRTFVSRAAIGLAVNDSKDIRFGLGYIKKIPNKTFTTGSKKFDSRVDLPAANVTDFSSHNDALIENLYFSNMKNVGRSSTPLRLGLKDVGDYYSSQGVDAGNTSPIIQSCQHNFAVIFSDGHYNQTESTGIGDIDGDGQSNRLADVARKYYVNDLNTNLDNNVINPNHPDSNSTTQKTIQHMVTFPVSFGLDGLLSDTTGDDLPDKKLDLVTKKQEDFTPAVDADWGKVSSSIQEDPRKIDDMWHAAYNSNGLFVSADTPKQLVDGLKEIISEVDRATSSSAALAASSGEVRNGSLVFQVFFNSRDWSGNVKAIESDAKGKFSSDYWTNNGASGELNDKPHSSRLVITRKPLFDNDNNITGSQGVSFRWDNLSDIQKTSLNNDANLLSYLRGDKTREGEYPGQYRKRDFILSDIISSAPFFVGAPFETYPSSLNGSTATPYQTFRSQYADAVSKTGTVTRKRKRMVYTAANDGMLHGFSVDQNGRELLAYIPSMAFPKLRELSYRSYKHRYIADGAPIVADAYSTQFGSDSTKGDWKSVLVAGLGAGGAGIYALDVTDPSKFSEAAANDISMWEFDRFNTAPNTQKANGDSDLGYTIGVPSVAMMNDGSWVAVFGNGYHNKELGGDGSAAIYIVDIATGGLIKKFDTPNTYLSGDNGMSSPALIDTNGDYKIDYIYAGDLAGNMWKLDVTSTSRSQWKFAYGTSASPSPLFKTVAGQPITTRPEVMGHPTGLGFMVLFGTGKFYDKNDNNAVGQSTQAFYGIWDKNDGASTSYNLDSSSLLKQEVLYEGIHNFAVPDSKTGEKNTVAIRITSDETDNAKYKINWATHKGWKLDLNYSGNSGNLGEKQVTNAVLRDGSIMFTTVLPTPEACTPGGSSWLMELDAADGSRLSYPPFDLNGDNKFDALDMAYGNNTYDNMPTSGVSKPNQGIYSAPLNMPNTLIGSKECIDTTLISTTEGDILDFSRSCVGSQGRQSWRYLDID